MKRILFSTALGIALALAGLQPLWAAPEVVVTIKPIHALVAGVMEGVGEPELLMDGMASPHTYQMRPSQAQTLAQADLVIWVGPGVESTFPEYVRMLPGGTSSFEVLAAPGLHLLSAREAGIRGEGGAEPDDDDHDHGGFDPHIWLDPANALALTGLFVAELSAIDPENAPAYRANGAAQEARLRALDAELRSALAPLSDIRFITFHDAYQYFEAAYGLRSVASIALSPDRSPGMRTIMELRYEIMDAEVACVFAEPQFEPGLVETLTEGTGARAGVLDPLGEDVPVGPGAYEAVMRELAHSAADCLSD